MKNKLKITLAVFLAAISTTSCVKIKLSPLDTSTDKGVVALVAPFIPVPITVTYTGSPYTFTQGLVIAAVTPTVSGTVTSCTSNPELPSGLAIDNTTCAISGTPTTNQVATNYTITATNVNGSTTVTISVAINTSAPSNLIYSGSPYTMTQGLAITTITPTVSGTLTSCTSNPALPSGLAIDNTTCAISGTPTTNQVATNYTITATNVNGSTTATISIAINTSAPSNLIYSGSPYTFTQGLAITTITPTVSGTVTLCSSNPALPAGLAISATTCAISGTPSGSQAATNYTITASNLYGSTTATISITINTSAPTNLIYSGSPFTLMRYVQTTITPTITGTVTSCTSSPALPAGLAINATTCTISGKPTVIQTATSYTITASNVYGSTTANINITINVAVAQVNMSPLPGNYAGTQSVTIATGTPGSSIYYTTDGTAPATAVGGSTLLYTAAISVTASKTIKAIAVKTGYVNSPVGSASYTIAGTATYAVGGWVSGLQGTMTIVNSSSGENLVLTSNGPFHFGTPLASGVSFSVTILSTSGQVCRVDVDDTGTASKVVTMPAANYLNVSVVCDGDVIPTPTYVYTGPTLYGTSDYTTTDTATGLIWKTCSEGLSGATCTGTATTSTWIAAGSACYAYNAGAGYGGRKDWRLPSINELKSIVKGTGTPSVDTTAFPGTVVNWYWSASTVTGGPTNALHVTFSGGSVTAAFKTNIFYVRCVAGP